MSLRQPSLVPPVRIRENPGGATPPAPIRAVIKHSAASSPASLAPSGPPWRAALSRPVRQNPKPAHLMRVTSTFHSPRRPCRRARTWLLLYSMFPLATFKSCESAVPFKPCLIRIATIAAQRQRLCGQERPLTHIKTDTGRCGYVHPVRPGSGYSRAVPATSRSAGWRTLNCGNGKQNSTPHWNRWRRQRPGATA